MWYKIKVCETYLEVSFSVYDNDECVGVWESEGYKNANKTKTSNL